MSAMYHLPIRPYSPLDAHNRHAAALGSPLVGAAASRADYNGHRVTVDWNAYRSYYVAEYFWAGRIVLGRGTFETCLRAAIKEYQRGALGASVAVTCRDDDAEAAALCVELGLVAGSLSSVPLDWWTWRHDVGHESAPDYTERAPRPRFDWELLQASESREEYKRALCAKYGRTFT